MSGFRTYLFLPLVCALLAAGCGGGGSGSSDDTAAVTDNGTGGGGGTQPPGGGSTPDPTPPAGGGDEPPGGGNGDPGDDDDGGGGGGTPPPAPSIDTAVTDCGSFQGEVLSDGVSFKGIPFAAPPIGQLRFKPPAEPACSDSVQPAVNFPEPCAQFDQDGSVLTTNEDCLYLNVWTPAREFPSSLQMPVMVFVHGGGNAGGSTSDVMFRGSYFYDGEQLAARGDVVVVTVEYRLGALGFLAHPALSAESSDAISGNYGSLDQIAALKWVQRNIAVMGGDPDRVTLFGESAGARDVCTLVASPLAAGLFAGAIVESGACGQSTLDEHELTGEELAALVGCPSPTNAACLRNTSVEDWLDAVGPGGYEGGLVPAELLGPNIDGHLLLDTPWNAILEGTSNPVPLIIGANDEETSTKVDAVPPLPDEQAYIDFINDTYGVLAPDVLRLYPATDYPTPLDAFVAATTDQQFICPMWRVVRGAALNPQPVYWYRFGHSINHPDYEGLGAFHAIELYYLFQHMDDLPDFTPSADDLGIENAMLRYWTSFAATGDPNSGGGLPYWAPYDGAVDNYHRIDVPMADTPEDKVEKCEFWVPAGT